LLFEHNPRLSAIGATAFAHSSLKEIIIPSEVTVIGQRAFACCGGLAIVLFENEAVLKTIEDSAFYGTALRSISIPKRVTVIGDLAFGNCSVLDVVWFDKKAKIEIGREAFTRSALKSIILPPKVVSIGRGAFPPECIVALNDDNPRKKLIDWHLSYCHAQNSQLAFEGGNEECDDEISD
jgi:hypothetical protein